MEWVRQQVHAGGEVTRHDAVAQAPAGHRVGLGESVHDNRAFLHAGQGGNRRRGQAVIDDARIDFIRHHPAVVLLGLLGDVLQILQRDDAAGGIARRVDDDEFGLLVDELVEGGEVEGKLVLLQQRNRHRDSARHLDHRLVGRKARIRVDDFVAMFDQRQGREKQVWLSAGADHHLVRREINSAPFAAIFGDGFAQGGHPRWGRVARLARADGFHARPTDVFKGRVIGLTDFEVDDLSSRRFELVGARQNLVRPFGLEVCRAICKGHKI